MPDESTAVAVTARGLDDYRHMFALDDDTLVGCHYLDCASGASAFGVELRASGGRVFSAALERGVAGKVIIDVGSGVPNSVPSHHS